MVKRRPQLNSNELQQLRWLLGGIAAVTAVWAVAFVDAEATWLLAAITAAIAVVLWKPALPARVPLWLHRLAFPAIAAVGAYDFYAEGEALPAMTKVALLLLAYRATNYRRRRDELQLVVLGLFLVVIAGVLTVSMGFALQIMAFTGLALAMLMAMTLTETDAETRAEKGAAPAWAEGVEWLKLFGKARKVADWRVVVLGGTLFAGVAVMSGLLFLAIPRFELGGGLFLEGLIKRKSRSGFTDTLRFGDVAGILRDEGVAMRVEVEDRSRLPEEVYWRMVVLDEYRDQAFRLSAALKSSAFQRPLTTGRLMGMEPPSTLGLTGTFYLEAGVGRYLPLTGGFRSVNFTEPQNLRWSGDLKVIELSREPMAMKAYRVRGMSAADTVNDPGFGRWLRLPPEERRTRNPNQPTMLEVNLSEGDRRVLAETVQAITGGVDLPVAEFAERARVWLGRRHAYSLSMELPAGAGDPLVRWLVSEEPGHCELFAGAFTLLARTAGHPTRVVGGFVGGAWNGDYLIVRNSDAHAWCEVFDGRQGWVRIDPTVAARNGAGEEGPGGFGGGASLRDATGGWEAQMDRLRLFWYRRIVNFDQGDQRVMAESLKDVAKGAGAGLKEFAEEVKAWARSWLLRPWDSGKISLVTGTVVMLAVLGWAWRRLGRATWMKWRSRTAKRGDPVRREAGRWLRRLAEAEAEPLALAALRRELERLRYGRRDSWADPVPLWREARRLNRKRRRPGGDARGR